MMFIYILKTYLKKKSVKVLIMFIFKINIPSKSFFKVVLVKCTKILLSLVGFIEL